MTTETEFDLSVLVDDVIASNTSPNPLTLAREVADKMSDADMRSAIVGLLLHYMDRRLARSRLRVTDSASVVDDVNPAPNLQPSRWSGMSQLYMRWLSSSVNTGNEMKRLGDCTLDDVAHLYAIRMEIAKNTATEGMRFQRLQVAMKKHKAQHVSDLPELVVIEIIRWQPKEAVA